MQKTWKNAEKRMQNFKKGGTASAGVSVNP
jgi:hypothetical protein